MQSHIHAFHSEYRRLLGNIPLPPEIAADYQIEDCLSESADRSVFLVRALADGKPYVLKTSAGENSSDLSAEYDMLRTLNHPCIPKAAACFEQDGRKYLIREYIPGKTLYSIVSASGPLPAREAAELILRLCGTLSYLHRLHPPVIHRDIKPQNILLADDGRCALIDFGIARRFDGAAEQDTVCMGTQATAAPEQFGYRQTDIRSDVYSTGILLLYLLTGSFQPVAVRLIQNPQLRGIVRRCIRFDPVDRFSGIRPLQNRLKCFLHPGVRILLPAGVAGAIMLGGALMVARFLPPSAAPEATAAVPVASTAQIPVAPESYVFSSPQIEQAVREQLHLGADDPVTQADLDRITGLYICGERTYASWDQHDFHSKTDYIDGAPEISAGVVHSLTDIAQMHHLTELALYNQRIVDLTPLRGLPLMKLGLGGNRIEDLSVLEELTGLTALYLENNPLSDIAPLQPLNHLESLDLTGTQAADISPLSGLPLVFLSLMDCPVQDTAPLCELPKLNWLCLSNLTKEQAEVCGQIATLNNLTLYRCGLTSLKPFSSLEQLLFLDLLGNDISSIDGLDHYPLLGGLCIRENPVTDLAPLKDMAKLTYLNIGAVPAQDFTPLADVPLLSTVDCSADQLEAIQAVLRGRSVSVNAY